MHNEWFDRVLTKKKKKMPHLMVVNNYDGVGQGVQSFNRS